MDPKKICKCLREGGCQKECRQHIDYPEDDNCVLVAVEKHGDMTLREIGERMGITHVRVMQIENVALEKVKKRYRKRFAE